MPNTFERFLTFWKDFNEGRLSHEEELALYAWRRLLPKNERAYRNRSSQRKISMMILKFVEEQIWLEELIKLLRNDERFNRMFADMDKNTSNTAS